MLGISLPSTSLTFDSGTHPRIFPDLESYSSNPISPSTNFSYATCIEKKQLFSTKHLSCTRWKTRSSGKTPEIVLSDDETKSWEACRQAFSGFEFTIEEQDKILGKAFGLVRSPYWGEEREKVIPNSEEIDAILDYLRGLGLSNDDISKVLKKFPEVVGCSLENELKTNIEILEKQWSIKGKSLRNLLLRNPKVLGYIIDCKGDCKALCTRCWVRF